MKERTKQIELNMEQLRAIGSWAADCAKKALSIYEDRDGSDSRPREAIEGVRVFANGGKRTAQLRKLALAAFSAGRETSDEAAAAAARAACLAASSAYTHPLADVDQTKHIVGAAAYAALAIELDQGGDEQKGEEVVQWAIAHAPTEAREILMQMPLRTPGKSRLDRLMYEVDAGIRGKII
ncbi:MAG: putative immunity protein [Anaerolineaceae bacterium]